MFRLTPVLLVVLAATAVAQEQATIRADVNQVFVTFSAADSNGRTVLDLKPEELQLKDDKRSRAIQYFARDVDVPLTIGIVVDMSGSQRKFFEKHRQDVEKFLRQVLRAGDQAFLVSLANEVRLVTDLTGSVDALLAGVDRLGKGRSGELLGEQCSTIPGRIRRGRCVSVIWEAVYSSARLKLNGLSGRKAIILLSDGIDFGSQHSVKDVIEAAQASDAPIYTLTSQDFLFSWIGPANMIRSAGARGSMQKVAEETGGRSYKASGDKIPAIFAEIEADLRSLYIAGFALPAEERDGRFHKLELQATRPKIKIRARKGYVAER